mmetsp:Transcript_4871/g.6603  ORF Transcript_4871/g.6603 Transcript_4871/m.6603 type:complete len:270 (+) Transcript_4871:65-874(+)
MEVSSDSLISDGDNPSAKSSNTRQRKLPKTASDTLLPSLPILARLESSKPPPLQLSSSSPPRGPQGLPPPLPCPDSSKPLLPPAQAPAPDLDLAVAAALAALALATATVFVDMDMLIELSIQMLVPRNSQVDAMDWAASASLEVAMWTSCAVVEACLVTGVYAALYSWVGLLLGLLPGTCAGFTVAVARFNTHAWARGTVLLWMPTHLVALMTAVISTLAFVITYYLDSRKRSHSRGGNAVSGLGKFGWCSPQALMSLRISPMTRFPPS